MCFSVSRIAAFEMRSERERPHLPAVRYMLSDWMKNEGATVAAGEPLMVMIAMKMEYVIKANAAGTVSRVTAKVGDFVEKNKVLVAFEAEE